MSKHDGDFYCLNCFHSFKTKNKFELDKKLHENKDFCDVAMPSDNTKILEFNQYWKPDKTPSIIYADIESFILKKDECKNNSEKSSTIKVGENNPCGYSMSLIWTFACIENKHNAYSDQHCIKNFCECLREHTMNKINFEKKIIPLTNKEHKS